MHKRVALSVLAIAALLVSAAPAFADEPVYVNPACPPEWCGTYYAKPSDTIVLYWGWFAATKGLMRAFFNHVNGTLVLEGPGEEGILNMSPAEFVGAYGPVVPVGEEDAADWFGLDCPMPYMYLSEVFLDIGALPEGTYTLTWTSGFDQPVNDGLHACTDLSGGGIPAPSLYRDEAVVVSTIIVE